MKNRDLYDLYVGGKAKGKDADVGFLLKENLTADELYHAVEDIIVVYSRTGKKRETFHKFLKRIGKDNLILTIDPFKPVLN